MAQQALPQGATRRRAAFGLFDADGWTWAGLKATFWFLFIIFMRDKVLKNMIDRVLMKRQLLQQRLPVRYLHGNAQPLL